MTSILKTVNGDVHIINVLKLLAFYKQNGKKLFTTNLILYIKDDSEDYAVDIYEHL
ncbi:hypothetical protein ACTFRP_28005 [Bacillus cereus group sp. MYBK234-1]|uniref:hypothetical protein n=1 Tax=unclassified Bacillus cereus group TaxID=2750818 RepID=UPI003F7ACB97